MKANKLGFTLLALAGLISFTTVATAQEKKEEAKPAAPKESATKASPQDRLKQIVDALGLTAEQTEKVKPIFQEQMEKTRAIFTDQALSQEDKRTKFQELRTSVNAKLKPILTAEQAEKWEKFQAQAGKKGKKQS
jgi:protein CpxP